MSVTTSGREQAVGNCLVAAGLQHLASWVSAIVRRTSTAARAHAAMAAVTATVVAAVGAVAGCGTAGTGAGSCIHRAEALAVPVPHTLLAVVPRTTAREAVWGLDELARLLPSLPLAGLELHILYTEDSDDIGDGGGDGGQPQILLSRAPHFPAFRVQGAPSPPANPTALSSELYCNHLAAWKRHANMVLRAESAHRNAALRNWTARIVARLNALTDRPIPDTSGTEAGAEIDASASIFSVAEVAAAAPRPTILFLGGLTALKPPSQAFRFPARLVALVRSSAPREVVRAEAAWRRWASGAGGSFTALSANDASTAISRSLADGWRWRSAGRPRGRSQA